MVDLVVTQSGFGQRSVPIIVEDDTKILAEETVELGPFEYADKLPLKSGYAAAGVRVVPGASATEAAWNVGAGVRLGLPGLGVFAEARLHNVFTEGDASRFVPVTLGIRL